MIHAFDLGKPGTTKLGQRLNSSATVAARYNAAKPAGFTQLTFAKQLIHDTRTTALGFTSTATDVCKLKRSISIGRNNDGYHVMS